MFLLHNLFEVYVIPSDTFLLCPADSSSVTTSSAKEVVFAFARFLWALWLLAVELFLGVDCLQSSHSIQTPKFP